MKKLDKRVVIWPAYFDSSLTRVSGRKVGKKIAIDSPTVVELDEIASKLNLNPKVFDNVRYPRRWWQPAGLLHVDKIGTKSNTLRTIGGKLLEKRTSGNVQKTS